LALSSKSFLTNPELVIDFTPNATFNADRFNVAFLTGGISLSTPNIATDVTFSNISKKSNDRVLLSGNTLTYYFINNFNSPSSQ
jgi:hypothetical protein